MTAAAEDRNAGLEGVIAGETTICTVEGGLSYRGYFVGDLAEHCSFDEVAYLLLYGELPTTGELAKFQARVAMARRLPMLSIWAIQRDNGGCPGAIDSNSCSGIRQPRWAFSHLFERYAGP